MEESNKKFQAQTDQMTKKWSLKEKKRNWLIHNVEVI